MRDFKLIRLRITVFYFFIFLTVLACRREEVQEKNEKLKDPTETEFFTTDDIGGLSAALVRESIQNTMDARIDKTKPAKIKGNK